MLLLTGTAEYMEDDEYRIKGERYEFNVFSSSEVLDDELKEEIGIFMGDAGWNEIDIKKTTLVPNEQNIEDKITLEAFNYALKNKFSIVVYGGPVDEKLKL